MEAQSKIDNNQILPPALIIDTNILLEIPEITEFDWGFWSVQLYILDSVVDELKGLMSDKEDVQKVAKAARAYQFIAPLQERAVPEGLELRNGKVRIFFVRPPNQYAPELDPNTEDHQQVAFVQEAQAKMPKQFWAVVTMDRDMANLSYSMRPPVKPISPSMLKLATQLRTFLARQFMSWTEEQTGTRVPIERLTGEPPVKKPRSKISPEERLQRVVRSFHSRIIAGHHRAILSIAPLEARLALTAHLVKCLKPVERRTILLFVENQALAEYWAQELRQRCKLSPQAVVIFHDQRLSQHPVPQVVIYRHDQIETRYRQHRSRLHEAQRLITQIVDGCDLLSPEFLVMLLLGNDQFIGYTRYPLYHDQTHSGRVLANFFEEESIINYTFEEAEEDRWLRSFDLIRHPVQFLQEELTEYQNITQAYQKARESLLEDYPNLRKANHFWEALQDVLEGVADSSATAILRLRELREETAQLAANKNDILIELLQQSRQNPGRNIVYDPNHTWAKCFKTELLAQNLPVDHLSRETSPEEWDRCWRKFDSGKLDTLIISSLPPHRMIHSHVNRLIMRTPICPLHDLANIVDWTLAHAHPSGDPVEIHLLYVENTPEEQAMLEFADSICGLKFS